MEKFNLPYQTFVEFPHISRYMGGYSYVVANRVQTPDEANFRPG